MYTLNRQRVYEKPISQVLSTTAINLATIFSYLLYCRSTEEPQSGDKMNTSTGSSVEDQVLNLSRSASTSERHLDDEYSSGIDDDDEDNDSMPTKNKHIRRHQFD